MADKPGRDLPRHRPLTSTGAPRYLPPAERSAHHCLTRHQGGRGWQPHMPARQQDPFAPFSGWGLFWSVAGIEAVFAAAILIFAWSR